MSSPLFIVIMLAASGGKHNVTGWHPSVPSAYSLVTHQRETCDAASVHFNPKIRKTDIRTAVMKIRWFASQNDIFSGASKSTWYLRAFRCESLYAVYKETAASYLSACRAAVGLYSCTVTWMHVRNCQHRTDYSVVTLRLQIQNCVAYIIFCYSNTVDC